VLGCNPATPTFFFSTPCFNRGILCYFYCNKK
jgi:hypothetical protein